MRQNRHSRALVRTTVFFTLAWLASMSANAADSKPGPLTVVGGEPVVYQCGKLKKVVARYYDLSDGSLGFVKLTVNEAEFTLPQVMAASGIRYMNELSYEWWSKGGEAWLKDVSKKKGLDVACKEVPVAH